MNPTSLRLEFNNVECSSITQQRSKTGARGSLTLDLSEGWGETACKLIHALCHVSDRPELAGQLIEIFMHASPQFKIIKSLSTQEIHEYKQVLNKLKGADAGVLDRLLNHCIK